MSQEKKVIRVLSNTNKSTNKSNLTYIVLGFLIGMITTVIIFLAVINPILKTSTQVSNLDDIESDHSQTGNLIASENTTEHSKEDENAEDDYKTEQPKINEINQIFQHKKQITEIEDRKNNQVKNNNSNPFENAFEKPVQIDQSAKQPTEKNLNKINIKPKDPANTQGNNEKIPLKPADKDQSQLKEQRPTPKNSESESDSHLKVIKL